jgi:hypothetical protein
VLPHAYRDLVATYIDRHFGVRGLAVYTEVSFGRTIIGKNRRIDILVLRESDQTAFAIECKYQRVSGTADEKIPYALLDLEALWIPGCLVYAGTGWSSGVLHTLRGSRAALFCDPDPLTLVRSNDTMELDHALAAVFGLWGYVIPHERRFSSSRQLALPLKGLVRAVPKPEPAAGGQSEPTG